MTDCAENANQDENLKIISTTESFENRIKELKNEYEMKIDSLTKQCEAALKDREAMVMKYAVSENSVINLKKQLQLFENRFKDFSKERENYEGRIKKLIEETKKLNQGLEKKENEKLALEIEIQKKKDELFSQSSNLKYFQNKLRLEQDAHRESVEKFEKIQLRLKEAKEETEQIRKDGQELLKKFQDEEKNQKEAEEWRMREKETLEELKNSKNELEDLKNEKNELEKKIERLEGVEKLYQQAVADLQAKIHELETVQLLFFKEKETILKYEKDLERNKELKDDVQNELTLCKEREAEMLEFTEKLTEKNVQLQTQLAKIEARYQQLLTDFDAQKNLIDSLTKDKKELADELSLTASEKDSLQKELEERKIFIEELTKQINDQIGENQLLKKKHNASLKELTRELNAYRKKEDAVSMSLDRESHTSSNSSLNQLDLGKEVELPDKQILVEKIFDIQRASARKSEKLEFLEEHNQQLVEELQKKSKVIQILVGQMSTGTSELTSTVMDKNKAAFAKKGGIMASIYNSKPVDESMTLELSLDMNRKLQAVLEDTLLKNITLKENIETLGSEIARLTNQKS